MLLIFILIFNIQCNYLGQVSQIRSDLIRVYLFPHSHDDVGWIKTINEYYFDYHGVQQIINSYIEELIKDKSKHFSQVEVAYFKMWWNEQNNTMKDNVKQLIQNQQLEFLSGGWCMNDEATTYYEDIIDQMTLGHKFLLENFNYVPSIGWQIDTFGHSNTQALFSNMMGFNAWFLGRIDHQERLEREKKKELEFVIHSDEENSIFTHINYYGFYSSPQGFDFDISNPKRNYVSNENLEQKSEGLDQYFKQQCKSYRGKILAHTLGMDFEWSNASSYFQQMDLIINRINNNSHKFNMIIEYGTPKQYIQALNQQNISYPFKKKIFFLILIILMNIGQDSSLVDLLLRDMSKELVDIFNKSTYYISTAQHHDAITGAAKQYVINDYLKMIHKAYIKMENQINTFLNYLSNPSSIFDAQCQFNESDKCDSLFDPLCQNQTVIVTIIDTKINIDGQQEYMKMLIPIDLNIKVEDEQGNLIRGDIICINHKCILYIPRQFQIITLYQNNDQTQNLQKLKKIQKYLINFNQIIKFIYQTHQDQVVEHTYLDLMEMLLIMVITYQPFNFQVKQFNKYILKKQLQKFWISRFDNQDIFYIDTFLDSLDISDQQGREILNNMIIFMFFPLTQQFTCLYFFTKNYSFQLYCKFILISKMMISFIQIVMDSNLKNEESITENHGKQK
ncbi:unnamed protein product [Paramecium primaurelia]|uniref:Glycoside hydrolase family 38 N-terminal domain-containing protein n=1 Tax=Paramecium primaurelia TaxID=5886 RepID=A0A8S1M904_PARPR|nr:unnamed protein product [Paramecium primaurelia]